MNSYKLKIKKFKDPNKGNWEVNLSGGYESISGKVYDIKEYKSPDKIKDSAGNITNANNGYFRGKGELINLIKPFVNPVTNASVSIEKIEAEFEDIRGWDMMNSPDQYFSYIAASVAEALEKKYKEQFGVEISIIKEPVQEQKTESPPPTTGPTEKPAASPGVSIKYLSTGASNNGIPMDITYEVFKDGVSLIKKENTTGFKYDEKTKKITISASETFYDMNGKWLESNGKDQFATKDQIFTLQGYPPEDQAAAATGASASGPQIYGEFTFDVQQQDVFFSKDFGTLELLSKGAMKQETIEEPAENTEEAMAEEEPDEYSEELFEGSDELIITSEYKMTESLPDSAPTKESTARVPDKIDFDNASFVGDKWKSFDIDKAIGLVEKSYAPSAKFKESLKKVLYYIKNDASIDNVKKAAYMLGTAFAESGYSLQRWEADYACGSTGVKYGAGGPCSSALKYYKSSKGKKNYYDLGTDNNGFPYFGRGLIQLTGKANYESYGKKIGQDLVGNGDLAMEPQNSYKIAAEFLKANTFSKVMSGDLKKARKSVNGGTKGIDEVNGAYNAWLSVFSQLGNAV